MNLIEAGETGSSTAKTAATMICLSESGAKAKTYPNLTQFYDAVGDRHTLNSVVAYEKFGVYFTLHARCESFKQGVGDLDYPYTMTLSQDHSAEWKVKCKSYGSNYESTSEWNNMIRYRCYESSNALNCYRYSIAFAADFAYSTPVLTIEDNM